MLDVVWGLWRRLVELDELHARVLGGSLRAAAEICEVLMRDLRPRVCAAVPGADRHLVDASIEDAVLAYLDAPARYEPARATLVGWLTSCAINKVRDGRRSERRPMAHEMTSGVNLEALGVMRQILLRMAHTDEERAFLAARLDGAPFEVQAQALGRSGVPLARLRLENQRVWDLVRRRLRCRQAHTGT